MFNHTNSKIFVVIPAFNEEQVINRVVDELLSYHYTIVLVDDGSAAPIADLFVNKPVYVLRHRVNLGQGAALQTGIDFALANGADYIVTFDADGQHAATDITVMLQMMEEKKPDVVLGSRFIGGANKIPVVRKMVLQTARFVNFLFTGLFLTDAHNGLRLLNRKAASQIILQENGMAHATEILWQIKAKRLQFAEVAVQISYTDYARAKGQSAWGAFRIIIDLFLNKFFR